MKFSVTIPAFKTKYLSDAIESVINQDYPDYELIIVDDCSPEDIKSIVRTYSDSRIRYFKNTKNYGAINVVDNWNICLSYCTGDYVICMGDDDMLMPGALFEYSKLIDKYPYLNVYHGRVIQIDENGTPKNIMGLKPEYEPALTFMIEWLCGYNHYIGDFCYKKDHLVENGGYYKLPLAWGSDDITAFRAASYMGIANTQKAVFKYRESSITITNTPNAKIKIESLESVRQYCKDYINKIEPKDITEELSLSVLKDMLEKRFSKMCLSEVCAEISLSPIRLIKWIWLSKHYNISIKSLILRYLYNIYVICLKRKQ